MPRVLRTFLSAGAGSCHMSAEFPARLGFIWADLYRGLRVVWASLRWESIVSITQTFRYGRLLLLLPLVGCAMSDEQITADFISHMDAKPPKERLPNWETTKALMLREAPTVGSEAPDFTLATNDGSDTFRLSQFEGDRPVVLIFGSWT